MKASLFSVGTDDVKIQPNDPSQMIDMCNWKLLYSTFSHTANTTLLGSY